jgi:phosphoribosylaminoimidazole-succinocarboxamide synthase
MVDEALLRKALSVPLDRTEFSAVGAKYEGKVRDCYTTRDGRRVLVTTDRISAFDRVLGTLPLKGQVLNRMAAFWFELTKDVCPSHLLSAPDPNVMIGVECAPLPLEVVVRSYLTGVTSTSIWTAYARGERTFCGHALPEGLKKNDKLPTAIVTPSTKAEKGGHDESVSGAELVAKGVISAEDFATVERLALAVFARGQEHCAKNGLILVDTRYEFGRAPDGRIVLMDEIHTPDSSRFWFAASYEARRAAGEEPESFDKEYVRRWLAAQGFTGDGPIPTIPDDVRVEAARRYIEAYERVTGETFVPDLEPPHARIAKALGLSEASSAGADFTTVRSKSTMRARVYVTLKREVLDPQGEAVRKGLAALGVEGVKDVRVGKVIDLEVDGDEATAREKIEKAARSLLANPVIEDFEVVVL